MVMDKQGIRVMSESKVMAGMLERVSLRIELGDADEETARQVCRVEANELVIHGGSMQCVAILFREAAGSRLAGRLRKLTLWILRQGDVGFMINEMPFTELEYMSVHVSDRTLPQELDMVFANCVTHRINTLSLEGMFRAKHTEILALSELRNLEDLKLEGSRWNEEVYRRCSQERGS